jgi:hypothetical protein
VPKASGLKEPDVKDNRGIFKPGDCVKTKPGVRDPDWESDIAGWQGRILRNEMGRRGKDSVVIEWGSVTLQGMPASMIEECEIASCSGKNNILFPSRTAARRV